MDSYPSYNPEDERSYPAAPKGGSGPDGVPLGPDHNPPSGGYVPNDEQWAGVAAFPLSSPYTGMSSGEPPAPIFRPELDGPGVARGGFPSRTDVGARSKPTNRRRVLAGLAAFLLLVLVVGGLAFVLLGGGTGSGHPTANGGNNNGGGGGAPVIVGTDTPTFVKSTFLLRQVNSLLDFLHTTLWYHPSIFQRPSTFTTNTSFAL